MKINSLSIRNYKCFRESGNVLFEEGFNVVVGANSSGKTALLEALLMDGLRNQPHRSTLLEEGKQAGTGSRTDVSISITGLELRDLILKGGKSIHVPIPPGMDRHTVHDFLQTHLLGETCEVLFAMQRVGGGGWASSRWPSHGLFQSPPSIRTISVGPSDDKKSVVPVGAVESNTQDGLVTFATRMLSTIYVFRAERPNIGRSQIVTEVVLSSDASNLPSALHLLHSQNPHQFDRLNRLVRQVFPAIQRITVVPVSKNEVEIRIWSSGYEEERADLAIPIASCGTGIGQVLAILYLAIASKGPRTIVIDEPSSFLHPSATRELLEVLRGEGRHQYILATHAPEVISAAEPSTITVLKWKGSESTATTYRGADLASTRIALQEVGARLSDVFGLDRVVWVEGATEAICFPAIVRAKRGRVPSGIAFIPIVNTGDLERKGHYGRLVGQIYRQLTSQSALMPQVIAVSLDGENRDDGDKAEITKLLEGKARFLPRRTLENYLLHPAALSEVLRKGMNSQVDGLNADRIKSWIDDHAAEPKYKGSFDGADPTSQLPWLESVDAPRLLADLFASVTEHKLEFRKIEHSVAILNWLLLKDSGALAELTTYVEELLTA